MTRNLDVSKDIPKTQSYIIKLSLRLGGNVSYVVPILDLIFIIKIKSMKTILLITCKSFVGIVIKDNIGREKEND